MAVVYDTRQRGTLACAYPTPEVAFAQGTGLGKLLLDFAETEARKAGFDSIYLYTHEKMTENRALYSRRGYVEFEPHLDSPPFLVYMRKPLAEAA